MPLHSKIILVITTCMALLGIFAAIQIQLQISNSLSVPVAPQLIVTQDSVSSEFLISQKTEPTFFDTITDFVTPKVKAPVKPTDPITAKAYLVGDVVSGKIYFEKNSAQALSVASMSKLVTAFAATDMLPLSTVISITEVSTHVASDTSMLQSGEHFMLSELLYPLLLSSSNVAAEALSSTTNRTAFLRIMGGYAVEVGMPSSHFADPSGLNPLNMASARDLFNLARYLYRSRPDILALTRTPLASTATTTAHGAHEFKSTHPFVTDPRFIGGKTGRTSAAGDTMLTILKIGNKSIAFIVLGSGYDERAGDTRQLITKVEKLLSGN